MAYRYEGVIGGLLSGTLYCSISSNTMRFLDFCNDNIINNKFGVKWSGDTHLSQALIDKSRLIYKGELNVTHLPKSYTWIINELEEEPPYIKHCQASWTVRSRMDAHVDKLVVDKNFLKHIFDFGYIVK